MSPLPTSRPRFIRTCCAMPAATSSATMVSIRDHCSTTSARARSASPLANSNREALPKPKITLTGVQRIPLRTALSERAELLLLWPDISQTTSSCDPIRRLLLLSNLVHHFLTLVRRCGEVGLRTLWGILVDAIWSASSAAADTDAALRKGGGRTQRKDCAKYDGHDLLFHRLHESPPIRGYS
jgi:hypothetical protein